VHGFDGRLGVLRLAQKEESPFVCELHCAREVFLPKALNAAPVRLGSNLGRQKVKGYRGHWDASYISRALTPPTPFQTLPEKPLQSRNQSVAATDLLQEG
jgi:hypothetical protein